MRNYGELTSDEVASINKEKTVVFLPVGAVEAHGPHLPLLTDFYQAEKVCIELAKRYNGLLAPPVYYGNCSSTRNFSGTISISTDTLQSLIYDILYEFVGNGFRNFVVITGHAGSGHMQAIGEACKRIVSLEGEDVRIMMLSDYDIAYELRGTKFPQDDGHGGLIETARMLSTRPELVKMEKAVTGYNRIPKFMVLRNPEDYWDGFTGEPQKATPELGREIDGYIIEKLSELIKKNFDL
ncbi:MAG: creatininase family protein [Thermoplasmata archaeon]|nr:creatininase family protein [Thermoplasmata archaeon]